MKIIKLSSQNIKKLKAVEITPKGEIVKVSGKNGQGKSSVLDSILYALGGKKVIPTKPVRDGEDKAKIELDLGDIVVVRTFTEKDSYLKVMTKDGAEYPKGQDRLTQLLSGVSFDPLEFANMSDKDQVETLVKILGIKDELEKIEEKRKEAFDERTIANRVLKDAKTVLDNLEKPADGLAEKEEVSASAINAQLEEERAKYGRKQNAELAVESRTSEIKEVDEQIARLEDEKKALIHQREEAKKVLEELKDFSEEKGKKLRAELDGLDEENAKIRAAKAYAQKAESVKEAEAKQQEAQKDLEACIEEKADLIKNAKTPIDGLNVEEGQVLFGGIPFAQLSTSEKLKVSMAISMAMSPELKVVRIMDGSLLDEDNLKVIEEMAKEKDFQVWVEMVDSSGNVGFVIEDGEVVKENA